MAFQRPMLAGSSERWLDKIGVQVSLLRIISMILAAGTAAGQSFDGVDDASRPVMEQARQRIEAIRKGDFRVRLVDDAGKPVSGSASVRLTRHAAPYRPPVCMLHAVRT
jgi:hypothetical protein